MRWDDAFWLAEALFDWNTDAGSWSCMYCHGKRLWSDFRPVCLNSCATHESILSGYSTVASSDGRRTTCGRFLLRYVIFSVVLGNMWLWSTRMVPALFQRFHCYFLSVFFFEYPFLSLQHQIILQTILPSGWLWNSRLLLLIDSLAPQSQIKLCNHGFTLTTHVSRWNSTWRLSY